MRFDESHLKCDCVDQVYEVGGARPRVYQEHPLLWDLEKGKGKTCLSFGFPQAVANNGFMEDYRDTGCVPIPECLGRPARASKAMPARIAKGRPSH